jgi:hypothetical protein
VRLGLTKSLELAASVELEIDKAPNITNPEIDSAEKMSIEDEYSYDRALSMSYSSYNDITKFI